MNMTKSELLIRMSNGDCSREELEQLFELLLNSNSDDEQTVILNDVWKQLDESPRLISEDHSIKIWKDIKQGMAKTAKVKRLKTNFTRRIFLRLVSTAAMLFVLVYAGYLLTSTFNYRQESIATSYGDQREVQLPDGSHVTLNSNSKITYSAKWKKDEDRVVSLSGEAFFEVKKIEKTHQKFKVITEGITVEVLGTSFNVNTHGRKTRVYLQEGKIQLNILKAKDQSIMMNPGDFLAYDKFSHNTQIEKSRSNLHTSWKDGIVFFKDAPLEQIFERLEEIFGVEFTYSTMTRPNAQITTGVPVSDLELAINIISASSGLKIVKTDKNTYKIYSAIE